VTWRRDVGVTGLTRVDNHSVSVQFSSRNNHPWWLTCVYGPQGTEQKIEFLQELRDIREACLGPWTIAGDYNLIYREEGKSNDNFNRTMMGRFRRLINNRVLCSVEWEELFPNCSLQSAASDDSDHCPLILGMNDIKPGKSRFHFESFWPKLEGFQEAVEAA
jgi:exonuclease III